MSRLVAAVLFVIVLVVVSHLNGPGVSGRCCADPAHATSEAELLFCPTRDRWDDVGRLLVPRRLLPPARP